MDKVVLTNDRTDITVGRPKGTISINSSNFVRILGCSNPSPVLRRVCSPTYHVHNTTANLRLYVLMRVQRAQLR